MLRGLHRTWIVNAYAMAISRGMTVLGTFWEESREGGSSAWGPHNSALRPRSVRMWGTPWTWVSGGQTCSGDVVGACPSLSRTRYRRSLVVLFGPGTSDVLVGLDYQEHRSRSRYGMSCGRSASGELSSVRPMTRCCALTANPLRLIRSLRIGEYPPRTARKALRDDGEPPFGRGPTRALATPDPELAFSGMSTAAPSAGQRAGFFACRRDEQQPGGRMLDSPRSRRCMLHVRA